MAVLKYKDGDGNYQEIVGINVQNDVVQTTGQSTTAVMSQKAVSDLIPAQASSSNQLADKDFVNSSVSTATATYQGSYNLVSDLSLTTQASHGQIEDALGNEISGADNNDYAFVQIPTTDSTPTEIAAVERYKFNGTRWSFEYTLNNSGFTSDQWAAVNSGITSGLVAKINALSNNPQSSIASLFGMDSSGNFQNITAANLASVMGIASGSGCIYYGYSWNNGRIYKYNASRFSGTLYIHNNSGRSAIFNITKTSNGSISVRKVFQSSEGTSCYLYKDDDGAIYVQHTEAWGSHTLVASQSGMQQGYVTSTDGLTYLSASDGTFYNDYDDLSSLASALGGVFHISQTTFYIGNAGGSYEMTGLTGCWILLLTTNQWDISAIVLASKPAGNVKVLGYHGGSSKTVGTESTNDVQIIHTTNSETVTVKSNDLSRTFRVITFAFA